jgi:hypothetical protein
MALRKRLSAEATPVLPMATAIDLNRSGVVRQATAVGLLGG